MGTNSLSTRSAGQVILDTFFNDFNTALNGDFVGRNASGVPTSGQNLGTAAYPWGTARVGSLIIDGSLFDPTAFAALQSHKVVSGGARSSGQPLILDPAGSGGGLSATLLATATDLVVEISGTSVTQSSDVAISSLTAAPSSNNTCLVNDTDAADQEDTRTWGERGASRDITVDTMGSEISALVGKFAAFKINDGSNDEYFLAYVESTTKLSKIHRGYFYDSSGNPINRIKFANNDTITLMKLGFVFFASDGTVEVSYTVPSYGATAPSSPTTADYWYDTDNQVWKRYNGSAFVTVTKLLIGMLVMNTADCIAARSLDFYANYSPFSTIELEYSAAGVVYSKGLFEMIRVAGREIGFGTRIPKWDMASHLAASTDMYDATEQASRTYHFYVKDDGQEVISDISPYWRPDLQGHYHPHNPWRCVGSIDNNGSSNFDSTTIYTLGASAPRSIGIRNRPPVPSSTSVGVGGFALSDSSGNHSTSSTSYVDVTNLSVTIKTSGRPVWVGIIHDGSANAGTIGSYAIGTDITRIDVKLLRDSTAIAEHIVKQHAANGTGIPDNMQYIPNSVIQQIDLPPPGTYTYKIQAKLVDGDVVGVAYAKLFAFEL